MLQRENTPSLGIQYRDSRLVSESTYGSFRSTQADSNIISAINDSTDRKKLHEAIIEFRKLVNQKKRGYSRITQIDTEDLDDKNYIRARLEVQKDDPKCIHTIKKILQRYGIAEALFMGDWLVTRDGKAQAEACGTSRFAEIETFMTQWYEKHGLINDTKITYRPDVYGGKLVHLSLGCGSGDIMVENQSSTDRPFGEGKGVTSDFWTEVGMCDKIYFSISALFRRCLKNGHTQEHILEFCDFLTTCINRDIQKQKIEKPNDPHDLQIDMNELTRYLLENATRYGEKIKDGKYARDGEFPDGKNVAQVSPQAQTLIKNFSLNPEGVLGKYFVESFMKGDIESLAPFLFHNIFVGKFENFDEIFYGDEPRFHMITSVRGSSHIDNVAYKNLIRSSCRKLKPGSVIIDDGIRRSYSRECRWREMHELASELGDDYKFHFIKSSNGEILSVFIQKVATTPSGERVCFTANEIKDHITGKEVGIAIPINSYGKSDESEKVYLIRAEVRSAIMAALLGGHNRESSDWNSLLKLGPVQDAIDRTGSVITNIARQIRIGQGDTKKAVIQYIDDISRQVMENLGTEVCRPPDSSSAISALQRMNDERRRVIGKRKPLQDALID